MDTAKLKPCPFCGGDPSFSLVQLGTGSFEDAVECLECAAMSASAGSKEEAGELWNRRTP